MQIKTAGAINNKILTETYMMKSILIKSFFVFGLLMFSFGIAVHAQDTSKRKTIDITSTFKPVLREAVKINFHASPPVPDTSKPVLTYNIPSQFLLLNYQPGQLKPVALQMDSLLSWENSNYIKVGAGNVHLPFVQTGFSFGDGKNTFFNVFADGYASKGNLQYQKNSATNATISGTVKTQNNLEWDGKLGFKTDNNFLYGFQPDTLKYNQEQLKQNFTTFGGSIALKNMEPTEFGLTYNPNLTVSVFSDNHSPKASESNSVLNLPLQKSLGDEFAFNLDFTADLTNYRVNGNAQENNLFFVAPALLYKTHNFNLSAGVTPSWDQNTFHLLPNFMADITTSDKQFTVQLGWISNYNKGSYQRYESINPWLAQPVNLLNTRVQERYVGIKGALDNHFTYSAKIGFNSFWNMPLFVNDSVDGKTFVISNESSMQDLQAHAEIGYTLGEKFTASAGASINRYTNLHDNEKAYGLLPYELNATLRWEVIKGLWLKSDLWQFNAGNFRGLHGGSYKAGSGFDLNAGVEFRITKQLNLWLQMNNLLNDKYQRWNQYQVYGFNILGGVVFAFGQK
jgi:hypothetical protein